MEAQRTENSAVWDCGLQQGIDEVIARIEAAFAEVEHPGDDHLHTSLHDLVYARPFRWTR